MAHRSVRDLRIVLLGKNMSEKSRVGNLILGTDVFKSEVPLDEKLHQHSERVGGTVKDRRVAVINSPNMLQPHLSHHDITRAVKECINLSDPGPHVFILVLKYNEFTELNRNRVKHVLKEFSKEAIKRTIVITTDEETYTSKFSSMFVYKASHQLIKECGGGHLQFDERNPELQSNIFRMVDKILNENLKEYLTCEIQDIKGGSVVEEQPRYHVSVRSEEENKNNDGKLKKEDRSNGASANVSRKVKLNLVLCGSNTTLTVSVSQILQGKKIKPSYQRVCSVDVELHGRLITLLELPALSQLSEEEVKHETLNCVSLCQPGVHAFIVIIPDAPLNNEDKAEIEKIQSIFDSSEHCMVLFTTEMTVDKPVINFAKSIFDSQSLCGAKYRVMGLKEPENSRQIPELLEYIENMKTEPYSLQMYVEAQENRVRHELEEQHEKELKKMEDKIKELQLKIPSECAEDEQNHPESLRIVLIGRTGSGKSATGNTILGRNEFHSQMNTDSVTTDCQKELGEVDGRSVAVVDTPGLFDTSLSKNLVVEEIMKCVSFSSPGPHVFVIVLSLGRFTKEETDTVDLIKKIFGHKVAQFSIVLFTRGDDLEGESIEDYMKRSTNAELKKLVRDCGNRFLAFNNREKQDRTQVSRLLKMIEEVKNSNQGRYFTNSMFEEAEMSIKKRMEEIMKEREREVQIQREELEAKYELDNKNMMKRLKEEKQRADEERMKMENHFRETEEKLRKEFEEKEKMEQMKREKENQKRSEEEKQRRAEYIKTIEEMKREIENQRSQYEKQQKEREEEDRKREERYRRDQEKMKKEQERVITELKKKEEEEMKKRDLEEKRKKEQEEKERQEWVRKIKEAENDRKETREEIKQQQREWEEKKKRQMREREEEERKRKQKHEEQLREKENEMEKMRKKFEKDREEERKMIEKERQKEKREREDKEKEYKEKKTEMNKHYEQLERKRREEWERVKREDDERQEEERKRWKKMIEDLKQEQEKEMMRRETERKEREKKERDEIKQNFDAEIKQMKRKHEDEARKQAEEFNDFRERKEQHVQELKEMLEDHKKQHELLEKLYLHLKEQKGAEIKELQQAVEELKNQSICAIL